MVGWDKYAKQSEIDNSALCEKFSQLSALVVYNLISLVSMAQIER